MRHLRAGTVSQKPSFSRSTHQLLLLHSGKPINTVATEQGLNRDTVGVHRDTWLAKGIAGLFDAPRCGAPRKLAAAYVPMLCDWARQQALSAPQLKDKLHEALSVKVSTWVGAASPEPRG